MSTRQPITCDICGREFENRESGVYEIGVHGGKAHGLHLDGPILTRTVPEMRDAEGNVLSAAIQQDYVDHSQAIDISDACQSCYDDLREYIRNKRTEKARR